MPYETDSSDIIDFCQFYFSTFAPSTQQWLEHSCFPVIFKNSITHVSSNISSDMRAPVIVPKQQRKIKRKYKEFNWTARKFNTISDTSGEDIISHISYCKHFLKVSYCYSYYTVNKLKKDFKIYVKYWKTELRRINRNYFHVCKLVKNERKILLMKHTDTITIVANSF